MNEWRASDSRRFVNRFSPMRLLVFDRSPNKLTCQRLFGGCSNRLCNSIMSEKNTFQDSVELPAEDDQAGEFSTRKLFIPHLAIVENIFMINL